MRLGHSATQPQSAERRLSITSSPGPASTTTFVAEKCAWITGKCSVQNAKRYNPHGTWTSDTTVPYTNQWVERTFTVNGTNAGLLKDPLWYASKYGGFKDSDKVATTGYNLPDKTAEWDANGDGCAGDLFLCAEPAGAGRETRVGLRGDSEPTSSGTAASVLSSSTTGEGAIYQSYFYPTQFEAEREIKYAGYTQSLFVDTYGNFREDTVKDNALVLNEDRIVVTRYDALQ